jgi:hypothetical protein
MADEQTIKRMEERIDNLERLLNLLLTQLNPATAQTTAGATPDATNTTPPSTTKAPKKEVPCLMTLPTEIRILIIEHLFRPLFRPKPNNKSRHGLILPRRLPISLFTSKNRFPACTSITLSVSRASKFILSLLGRRSRSSKRRAGRLTRSGKLLIRRCPLPSGLLRGLGLRSWLRGTFLRWMRLTRRVEFWRGKMCAGEGLKGLVLRLMSISRYK